MAEHPIAQTRRRRGDYVVCLTADRARADLDARVHDVRQSAPDAAAVIACREPEREIDAAAPADVVIVDAGCTLTSGWLARLREAAYSDSRAATASAIVAAEPAEQLASLAANVAGGSLHLRPDLAEPGAQCAYIRRDALELAGPVGAGFARRCIASGLTHVLADDVLIGGARDWPASAAHPRSAPLARALGRVRRARRGLNVIVDAGIVAAPISGTNVHVLELIAALARADGVRVAAIVPDNAGPDARASLAAAGDVHVLSPEQARQMPPHSFDVAHRPYQVASAGDLTLLGELAERVVITQQDLIGYSNPAYFPTAEAWESYRRLTRGVLAVADRVLFFSAHARAEALADELAEPGRARVVAIGVDHRVVAGSGPPTPPAAAAPLGDAEIMLCLGVDYRHKNRLFALEVMRRLRVDHGWAGRLALAGPSVPDGSSREDEARLLAADPELASAVVDCGMVSDAEREWLYGRARLVIYPTVYEGFGLVPFEAAAHGAPCLWAPVTSLTELLPAEAAGIVPWDSDLTAQRALALLTDEAERAHNVATIAAAGAGFTWDATAAALIDEYEQTCDQPATPASEGERRVGRISDAFSEDAVRLVGPGGALAPELHRPLLALANRPRLIGPVSWAVKLGYRTAHRVRLRKPRGR